MLALVEEIESLALASEDMDLRHASTLVVSITLIELFNFSKSQISPL